MRVVVFGATGPTGQLIVRGALAAGHHVTVVARTPDKITERHERLRVERGDVHDPASVAHAVAGQDAVVSAVGVSYTRKPVTVYSAGARNILAAMRESGVRRFIGITSGGTSPGREPGNPFFFERILKPLFHTLYDDMREMERIVMASDLDWTILRPPRLMNRPATGKVRIGRGVYALPGGATIARGDLAAVVVAQLGSSELVRVAAAIAD
jgi:putative NADH-flavin reductase